MKKEHEGTKYLVLNEEKNSSCEKRKEKKENYTQSENNDEFKRYNVTQELPFTIKLV